MGTRVEGLKATRKAVVPAAGLGWRLRPITNVVPKEMFPIGRHPAIEWVLAEAVASSCTDVAVVISPRKRIIEKYLTTCCPELVKRCRLTFLVQQEPLGLGHALLLARDFCEGRPFAVLLPDDLVDASQQPLLQMVEVFETMGGAVFALAKEPVGHAGRYGRWQLKPVGERVYRVDAILPRRTEFGGGAPIWTGVGRCLFGPEFLDYGAMLLARPRTGELDDGMILQYMLKAGEAVHGVHIEGQRFDVSTPDGYIAAWQRFGKERPTWECL